MLTTIQKLNSAISKAKFRIQIEALKQEKVEDIINDFLFTGRMATEDEVIEALEKQPSVLQRESISTRITEKIKDFVKTFINGVDN